jgi:hypothetical protein
MILLEGDECIEGFDGGVLLLLLQSQGYHAAMVELKRKGRESTGPASPHCYIGTRCV